MWARRHRSPSRQDGFTVLEVLIAMVILTVGILGALVALISAGSLTMNSQVHEGAIGFAEQQIEALRQQPFTSLGMTTPLPTYASAVNDPNHYTNVPPCNGYMIESSYYTNTGSSTCQSSEPFVTVCSPACAVPAQPRAITGYQGLTGQYDVYVTTHYESQLASPQNNGCITIMTQICLSGAEKRITVAVWPSTKPGSGARTPVWVTSIVTDPNTPLL